MAANRFLFISALAVAALAASSSDLPSRALALADRFVTCLYDPTTGTFDSFEALWQSGNTLETLARLSIALNTTRWATVFSSSYTATPVIVDNCFDDHQWWGLAWVSAYEASGVLPYLQRAGAVFEDTAAKGWQTARCGGGVLWCPPPTNPYLNAITVELFLSSAMALHPHAAALGKPATYYSDWASRVWAWLGGSGMINSQYLVNDGLTDSCVNNQQTTWTYNQGVLLSGLAKLSAATGNATALTAARAVANATTSLLVTPGGILEEPTPNPNNDQRIFKGVWARHLAAAGVVDAPGLGALATSFLAVQASSILANAACESPAAFVGHYGLLWEGPCGVVSVSTSSAALDALTAAIESQAVLTRTGSTFGPAVGLGGCVDASGAHMPYCQGPVMEGACAAAADAIGTSAVAYSWSATCSGVPTCRVHTLGGASACPVGWTWNAGPATSVVGSDGVSLGLCVVRG